MTDIALPYVQIRAEPVGRLLSPKGVRGLIHLVKAQKDAGRIIDGFKPDIVFGTGGYVAAPTLMAQRKRKGQYVLHEQNAVAGKANRMMGKHAAIVCLVFERAKADFKLAHTVVTGMPLRKDAIESEFDVAGSRAAFDLAPDRWTVFVYGGSQGAQALNEAVLSTVQFMPPGAVQWLHVAGEKNVAAVESSAERVGLNGNYAVRGFLNGPDVGMAFRAADMAIVRCGASTLCETLAWGLPSVLIPLPTAAANHQFHNAKVVSDAGAGRIVRQSSMSAGLIAEAIETWRDNPAKYDAAKAAALSLFRPNATEAILDLLYDCAGRRGKVGTANTSRKVS
jgi:UDP-N-acetylglucosamine--N-acetylmuramyl-(pentapeptide) pyrophosphoryl-undecaprenol N-acetylglucosamine transferase